MNVVYEAIDATGRQVRDVAEAGSVREAVESLRQRGLMVTHVERARDDDVKRMALMTANLSSRTTQRMPLKPLMMFTRQMAMLLTSGSAVVPALAALAKQVKNPSHAGVIRRIQTDVEEGLSLTNALRKHPGVFDPIYCAITAAGESSATLPQMFTRLATMLQKRRAIRNKVLGAMAYPALLVCLCTAILGILLFFVMPRFGEMFRTLNVPLPASTAFMLHVAETVHTYWPAGVASFVGTLVGAIMLVRSAAGRQWLSDIQIRVPLYGRLASRLIQGQLLRVLGMLVESHVSVLESIDMARKVTKNRHYQAMFDAMENAVTSGGSLSRALGGKGLVAPAICQAVHTGETSGSLGQAISFSADVLDEENGELVNTLTRLVEPMILIVMGVVVGGVAISLFMPLFDMTAAIN